MRAGSDRCFIGLWYAVCVTSSSLGRKGTPMSGRIEAAGAAEAFPAASPMRHVLWASVIGTFVEWYDFLIYGTAAALVFNKLFFPSINPSLGTIAAFGTYGVGFLARPFGAAI